MIFAIELDGVGELTVHLALAESSDSLQLTDLKLFLFCTSLMWKNLIKFVAVAGAAATKIGIPGVVKRAPAAHYTSL